MWCNELLNFFTYAQMLFVDFSSEFNTIIVSTLTTKLGDLSINTSLCNHIVDFMTNRPQHVRPGHICCSSTPSSSTTVGLCMDATLWSSLQTTPQWLASSVTSAYREEVQHRTVTCSLNPASQRSLLWTSGRRKVWYGNCSVADHKTLQWVVKTTQCITRTHFLSLRTSREKDVYISLSSCP